MSIDFLGLAAPSLKWLSRIADLRRHLAKRRSTGVTVRRGLIDHPYRAFPPLG